MSLEPALIKQETIKNPPNEKKEEPSVRRIKQADQKQQLARIYRTFSSKKYMKFRHQYPRMQQTEIINRIIRQWQALTKQEKLNLGVTYNQKEMYNSDDEENGSNFPLDSGSEEHKISDNQIKKRISNPVKEEKIILQKSAIKTKYKKDIILKVEESDCDLPLLQQKDIKDEQNSQSPEHEKSTSKNQVKKEIGAKPKKTRTKKTKQIKKPEDYLKLQNGEYLMFFKHYFSRLSKQHPRWSSTQLSYIIKLLWKKKKQQQKKNKAECLKQELKQNKQPSKQAKRRKNISGKEYFTREKKKQKITKEQIEILWKHLPRESKADWNKKASELSRSLQQDSIKIGSNMKSEASEKTETGTKNNKYVVKFRDCLLKGSIIRQEPKQNIILQQKNEFPQGQNALKKDFSPQKYEPQIRSTKKQDYEYVTLATNPFGFMKNKISLEKINIQ